MSNTRFSYTYRDGMNFKRCGHVIFTGTFHQEDLEKIQKHLFDGEHFIPKQIGIPERFSFKPECCDEGETVCEFIGDYDHCWHEFYGFDATQDEPTDPRTVRQFADEVMKASLDGWKEELSELPEGLKS